VLRRYAHMLLCRSFMWHWMSVGLLPSLTTKWFTECCSYLMLASYRAAIFACFAWHREGCVVPYTVYASKPTHADDLPCLQLHTVGSQSTPHISTHTHFKVFHLTRHHLCVVSIFLVWLQSRPFGVAILFAGCDEKGPQLFHMDPSGTFVQFEAKAIGSGSEGAQQSLQEVYHKVQSRISRQHPFHIFWLSMSVVLGSVYYKYSYVV